DVVLALRLAVGPQPGPLLDAGDVLGAAGRKDVVLGGVDGIVDEIDGPRAAGAGVAGLEIGVNLVPVVPARRIGRGGAVELEEAGRDDIGEAAVGNVPEEIQGHQGADGDRDAAVAGEAGLVGRQQLAAADRGGVEAVWLRGVYIPGQLVVGVLVQLVRQVDVESRAGAGVADRDGVGGRLPGHDRGAGG